MLPQAELLDRQDSPEPEDFVPGLHFDYECEFIGCNPAVLLNPTLLTGWYSVIISLHYKIGSVVIGGSGTGKTHMVRELTHYFGKFCLSINCNCWYTPKSLTQLFFGVSQGGVVSRYQDLGDSRKLLGSPDRHRVFLGPTGGGTVPCTQEEGPAVPVRSPHANSEPELRHLPDDADSELRLDPVDGEGALQDLPHLQAGDDRHRFAVVEAVGVQQGHRVPAAALLLHTVGSDAAEELDHRSQTHPHQRHHRRSRRDAHSSDRQLYQLLLNKIFGIGSLPVPPEPLKKTLQNYWQTKKLKLSPKILGAVLDLYELASRNKGFELLGAEVQHKSTAFELVKVLLAKHDQKNLVAKRCYVGAYSAQELYGLYKKDPNSTSDMQAFYPGTVPCQVREMSQEFPYSWTIRPGKATPCTRTNSSRSACCSTVLCAPTGPSLSVLLWTKASAGASGTCGFFIQGNNEKVKVPLNMKSPYLGVNHPTVARIHMKFVFCADNLHQMSPLEVTRLGKMFLESDYSWEDQIEKDFARIRELHTLEDARAEIKALEFIKKFFYGLWSSSEPELVPIRD